MIEGIPAKKSTRDPVQRMARRSYKRLDRRGAFAD
jgi:hypothetical protein